MYLTDLHNHTNFSYDGKNTCEEIIENAISNGIEVIGICDHQFSVGSDLYRYVNKIKECKNKYSDRIKILCGLEIGCRPKPNDLVAIESLPLDYCLFESLDSDRGAMDFYEFLEWARLFTIPKGLAHTDIFSLERKYRLDILKILKENNFFWELNTSGNYNYYYDFITNSEKQRAVSKSKITVSIGSDTHFVKDFNISKIKSAHSLFSKLDNPIIFS